MDKHLLIIGAPAQQPQVYFNRLLSQLRASEKFSDYDILVLLDEDSKDTLEKIKPALDDHDARFMTQDLNSDTGLMNADANKATHVVLLAKDKNPYSDAYVFSLLYRLRAMSPDSKIVTETLQDETSERFRSVGASCVLRPMRAYPEMVVRTLVAPGSEGMLANLFSSEGDECMRVDLSAPKSMTWIDVVTEVMKSDRAFPVGYIDKKGKVFTCPQPSSTCEVSSLLIIIKENDRISCSSTLEIIEKIKSAA